MIKVYFQYWINYNEICYAFVFFFFAFVAIGAAGLNTVLKLKWFVLDFVQIKRLQ